MSLGCKSPTSGQKKRSGRDFPSTSISVYAVPLRSAVITMKHHPAQEISQSSPRSSTVIIGGGVIGLATAYYLALPRSRDATQQGPVYIIDSSDELFSAASGHATGILHSKNFEDQSESRALTIFSYNLHAEVAGKYDSRSRYGFNRLVTYGLYQKLKSTEESSRASSLPSWLKNSSEYGVCQDDSDNRKLQVLFFVLIRSVKVCAT